MEDSRKLSQSELSGASSPNNLTVLPFLLPSDFLLIVDATTGGRYDDPGRHSSVDRRWIFLGLVALPMWILFGNLLVLLSVLGFRHLRTLSNWVIASLAFTDFLLALTVVPFGIYQLVSCFILESLAARIKGIDLRKKTPDYCCVLFICHVTISFTFLSLNDSGVISLS